MDGIIFWYISLFTICYTSCSSSIDPVKLTRASASSSSLSSYPSSSLASSASSSFHATATSRQSAAVKVGPVFSSVHLKEQKSSNIPGWNLHYGKRILPSNSQILLNNNGPNNGPRRRREDDFDDFDDSPTTGSTVASGANEKGKIKEGDERERQSELQVASSVARSRGPPVKSLAVANSWTSGPNLGDLQSSPSYSKPSGHQGFFQYARMPAEGAWEFGYRRGNHEHFTERHEHGASHHFKSKIRWGDKHGGYGEHYFDFNHKGTGDDPHVLQQNQQIKSHFSNPKYYGASSAIVTTNSGN